jgi:nucleoside-diphosphate kinase
VAQRTFSIIKPDAVRKGFIGAILAELDKGGFKIVAVKRQVISKEQAQGFYYVHKERPFFEGLTSFMSSGPIVLLVLEKDNAIADLRKLMGATNPANAMQKRGPSERSLPVQLKRTQFTARMPRTRRRSRLDIGSRDMSCFKSLLISPSIRSRKTVLGGLIWKVRSRHTKPEKRA